MPGPLVRLYGPSVQNDSWCRVACGMRDGLERLGELAGFFEMEGVVHELDDGMPAGSDAPVGVFVGPPDLAYVLRSRGTHRRRAVMIAANSSWLPKRTMRKLAEFATELIAPSEWAAAVCRTHSGLPVTVWRHGVDEAFAPAEEPADRADAPYRVLHLSSTSTRRKGTLELTRAWVIARREGWIPDDAELTLVLSNPLPGGVDETGPCDGMRRLSRLNMTPAGAAALYRSYDLVCQPSRAEGFGLVPLEARACGVPVCATACTGHDEHLYKWFPGVCAIHHGPDGPVDDGPGAVAPTVRPRDIAEALRWCYGERDALGYSALAAAPRLRQLWSWESVCQRWLDAHGQSG